MSKLYNSVLKENLTQTDKEVTKKRNGEEMTRKRNGEEMTKERNGEEVTLERTKSENSEEIIDTKCGIGSWRPEWLQVLATPTAFIVNFALVGVIQGFTGAYFVGSMTTLEKR